VVIGDISNKERMHKLFSTLGPEIVFHAAAYKHVPLMENNPSEAIRTNILGTKNLADLSVEFEVEKFIMISTDKAVNPTNVMGASKRIAEIYTQSLNKNNQTQFITTRFGNVLGSNGSVIPRLLVQELLSQRVGCLVYLLISELIYRPITILEYSGLYFLLRTGICR